MSEKEYIARGEALSELRSGFFPQDVVYTEAVSIAEQIIRAAPAADVVEVVRCKDCKHFGKDLGYGKHDCKKYEMPYCLEHDFCSYGERVE